MRLEHKIAIITGGGAGMGAATAKLFAKEGAKIAIIDIDETAANRVCKDIAAAGGEALSLIGDITDAATVAALVARCATELGTPTVLHNNAGIQTEGKKPLFQVEEDAFDRCVAVNMKAPWLLMKAVTPYMREAGGGSIINTASIGAFTTVGSIGYSASKAGLIAMTRVAAVELGPYNIRVNALCPGATMTPMAEKTAQEVAKRGIKPPKFSVLNGGRMATVEEMAYMALFLASDESSYATGVPFINDGGWMAMGGMQLNTDEA